MHGVKELIIPEKNTFSPTFSPTGCCELLSCLGNYGTLSCSRVIFFLLLAIIRLIHLQQKICSVASQEKTAALGITSEKKKKKIKTISCRCVYCFCWQLIKNSSLKQYVPNWQMWTVLNVEKCFPHESDLKHDCFWQQIFSDRFSNDLFMCVGCSAAAKAKDPYRYTSLMRNNFVYKPHRTTAEADTCSKIQILNAFI